MTLLTLTSPAYLRARLGRDWGFSLLALAGCAGFMFLDWRTTPIVLWDESRMAVNALEMHLSGHLSLVTTYGFRPDLWNTKPPLLIWLMDISMGLFGVSEGSLRLPSMLAALGTVALTLSFTRYATRSVAAGAAAAALLTFSLLFFGEHGARTADYEALLTFLTTGYLYVLFFALHRRRPGWTRVMLAGVLISLAVLTKSIAGLIPGVGVVVYILLVGRWRRPLQSPVYAVAGLMTALVATAWFGLRELAAPGYLNAMMFNDVSGRFTRALDLHSGPPWYYLKEVFADGAFSAGLLAAPAPLALISARGRAGLALLYSVSIAGGVIAVLSLSHTKLNHYVVSVLPFLAIATVIAVREGLQVLDAAYVQGRLRIFTPFVARGLALGLLVAIGVRGTYARAIWLPEHETYPQAMYGVLFRDLAAQGVTEVRVVDGGMVDRPGVTADGVPHDYAPQLDFYMLLARADGLRVKRVAALDLSGSRAAGVMLASCDPNYAARVQGSGANLTSVKGCVASERPALRPRA